MTGNLPDPVEPDPVAPTPPAAMDAVQRRRDDAQDAAIVDLDRVHADDVTEIARLRADHDELKSRVERLEIAVAAIQRGH